MRKHYIDNLRWISILLLIPYHAAMAWNVWGEPNYIIFNGNKIISSIIVFFSPYFMPLLFMLAGMSTKFALKKRTYKQYITERVKRLLVPLVFGTLVFMPAMTYIADKYNCNYSQSFVEHYSVFFTKFTDLTGADGGFSLGQFWFLLYLFIVSFFSLTLICVQRKILPEMNADISVFRVCLFGLPLPLLSELLSVGGKSLAEYTYIFILGYYLFSNDGVVDKISKYSIVFITVGVTACLLNVYLFIWSSSKHDVMNTSAKFIAEWFVLLGLIGIGRRYLDFSSKISGHLSKISFPFFSLHFICIVFIQYLLSDMLHSTFLLYFVPAIIAYFITFVCCELFIRVPVLSFLIGVKSIKRTESKNI